MTDNPWKEEGVPEVYDRRPSEATSRPLDEEGIPLLTSHEVAPLFGISHQPNSRRVAYTDIPHYVEHKGDKSTRSWFSLSHIVKHLENKAAFNKPVEQRTGAEISYGNQHGHYSRLLEAAKNQLAINSQKGIRVGSLRNQPDPGNKDIHARMHFFPNGREFTLDDPEFGSRQGRIVGTSSNIENPIRHGKGIPLVDPNETPDVSGILNASRPSRRNRNR